MHSRSLSAAPPLASLNLLPKGGSGGDHDRTLAGRLVLFDVRAGPCGSQKLMVSVDGLVSVTKEHDRAQVEDAGPITDLAPVLRAVADEHAAVPGLPQH